MTRPTDSAIARAFWEIRPDLGRFARSYRDQVIERAHLIDAESPAGSEDVDPIAHRLSKTSPLSWITINESPCIPAGAVVFTQGGEIKGVMHTIPEKVTTSPERVQIPAESKRVCSRPTCRAEMRPGLRCGSPHCGLKG